MGCVRGWGELSSIGSKWAISPPFVPGKLLANNLLQENKERPTLQLQLSHDSFPFVPMDEDRELKEIKEDENIW